MPYQCRSYSTGKRNGSASAVHESENSHLRVTHAASDKRRVMINAMFSSIWRIRECCAGNQDCLCPDLESLS